MALLALVALGVAEGALRLATLAFPAAAEMLAPSAVPLVHQRGFGHRPAPNAPGHDAWGFRNAAVPARADVVVLGDSQTYGEGVAAAQAWPRVVARRTGFGVYGLAYGGFGPGHYWLLRTQALSLAPRLVVASVYLGNDLYDAFALARAQDAARPLRPAGGLPEGDLEDRARAAYARTVGGGGGVRAWLVGNLRSVALARLVYHRLVEEGFPPARALAWHLARARAARAGGEQVVLEDGELRTVLTPDYRLVALDARDPAVAAGLAVTETALADLDRAARRRGARLAVLVIPTKERVMAPFAGEAAARGSYARLVRDETELTRRLLASLHGRSIPALDVLPALRGSVRAGSNPYPENADGHPEARGQAAIGGAAARWIATLLAKGEA